MLINYDQDEYETKIASNTCEYHKANPGTPWAGCTCSAVFSTVRRDPEEVRAIKARREREREDAILREAEEIQRRRS